MRNQFNRKLNPLGVGLFRGAAQAFPTADLTCLLTGSTYESEGATYYVNSKGNDVPVISGTGLDEILDFSVLNDDRFDKGCYVGSSEVDSEGDPLPEYYNSPYPAGFYYDDTSLTTRHYWKLTDFSYPVIQELQDITPQLLNNWVFLRAKATTDTSNVIDTIQSSHIYLIEQTGSDLTNLKSYIGIQGDFYGSTTITNGNFTVNVLNWATTYCSITWMSEEFARLTQNTGLGSTIVLTQTLVHTVGMPVIIEFWAKSLDTTAVPRISSSHYDDIEVISQPNLTTEWQKYEFKAVPKITTLVLYLSTGVISDGDRVDIDSIISKNFYQNYYSS